MRQLGVITNRTDQGKVLFVSDIREDDDGRVYFTADADIDADGANGQHGKQAAYMVGDAGSELLVNGGMGMRSGKVVIMQSWARDNVILDTDNEPKVFPGGIIGCRTSYKHPGMSSKDPAAFIDAEVVPYVVVPPLIVHETAGIVLGCRARVSWNGKSVDCVVADKGPAKKTGEISIAAARALGIPASPRHGGREVADVLYELWPGVAANVDGEIYALLPAYSS